ncbi:hypothetical protein BDZ45DRAFT_677924 [Acephala macrosclerotiorum]|nr:hypothetical protein BDZ45DRAFT_677924 [Acephala macrosclerotiorum]
MHLFKLLLAAVALCIKLAKASPLHLSKCKEDRTGPLGGARISQVNEYVGDWYAFPSHSSTPGSEYFVSIFCNE